MQLAIQWNMCVYAKPSQTKYFLLMVYAYVYLRVLCCCLHCFLCVFFIFFFFYFVFDWNMFCTCFWLGKTASDSSVKFFLLLLNLKWNRLYLLPWISVCHFLLHELFILFKQDKFLSYVPSFVYSLNSECEIFFNFLKLYSDCLWHQQRLSLSQIHIDFHSTRFDFNPAIDELIKQ